MIGERRQACSEAIGSEEERAEGRTELSLWPTGTENRASESRVTSRRPEAQRHPDSLVTRKGGIPEKERGLSAARIAERCWQASHCSSH